MSTQPAAVAAVDLGASSGRVLLVTLADGRLGVEQVARFANGGHDVEGVFSWDIEYLMSEIDRGLGAAARAAADRGLVLSSVGVDSWAVDYGLLDDRGALLRTPAHHRDPRSDAAFAAVTTQMDPWALYQRSGIALLSFNTLFQLVADGSTLSRAECLLLIPDLVNYLLSGVRAWEVTNASTTQLLDRHHQWDDELFELLAVPRRLVGPLVEPGHMLGEVTRPSAVAAGVSSDTRVIAVASHDTASAVVAVPATSPNFAYVSSGTWSLVGVEIDEPLIEHSAFVEGYTNELGAFGRTRFLRNVMGFWLLQEVIREFALEGKDYDAATLTREAMAIAPRRFLIDAESHELLGTGDMRGRLAAQCALTGSEVPLSAPEFARCIIDSLALAYRRAIRGISRVTGVRVDVVHIVGGGALNDALCQLTADALGVSVHAGPVEAAAIGNALLQFRGLGVLEDDLGDMRRRVAASFATTRYEPVLGDLPLWDQAESRLVPR